MIQDLEQVRYFFGKLMSVEDFQEEQAYFLNRLRRHNRCFCTGGASLQDLM
jgi:hypothetical protein